MVPKDFKFLDGPHKDSDLSDSNVNNDEYDQLSMSSSSDESSIDTLENDAPTSAGASTSRQHQGNNEDEEDKQNELIQAILQAQKIHRNHPPPIILEDDTVMDICFNPESDTIAVASVTGDIFLYKYNCEETSLISTIEIHLKACRDVEFSTDGRTLFSTGKDLCIAMTDMETAKLIRLYEEAHEQPVYSMTIINENMFATGDDDGVVKLWDLRRKGTEPIFSIRRVEDHISAMITNREAKYLVCASGDGCLTTINIPERRMHVQSEEYDDEFTCLGLFKSERKLLTASNIGKMYVFNWGEFGLHSDEFPSVTKKKAINCMVPITENILITGGEDGILRAASVFPHLQLGIVGQHNLSVEVLDISNDGTLVASASHDDIKFWNVQYFETLDITDTVKGGKRKQLAHNLPSSEVNNRADFFAEL